MATTEIGVGRHIKKTITGSRVREKYFDMAGGLNLVDAPNQLKPGVLLGAVNYEIDEDQGYQRIQGYERFDGQPSPSEATYSILDFDAGTSEPNTGDTITGGTSAATARVLTTPVVESGSWAGSDAAGYFVVGRVSGTFADNESLGVATMDGVEQPLSADSADEHNTFTGLAIEDRRSDINAIPGSGDVLGVWVYNGVTYGFRNNSSGSETAMYKSTSGGWSAVDLGSTIKFDTGLTAGPIVEGNTITGATSAATAVVRRVVVLTGDWTTNDATGHLTLTDISGNFTDGEFLQVSAVTLATSDGADFQNTLTADGTYRFVNYNFAGTTATYRMYGVNGVNAGFEFDGTYFTTINTGMTTDTPSWIAAHKKHLFFGFPGGSLQHSSIGFPLIWSAITGAAELTVGDEITGLAREVGNVLAITTKSDMYMLYGTSVANWDLKSFEQGSGAIENTVQRMGVVWATDDRGITTLAATQAYGDFDQSTVSAPVDPWLDRYRDLIVNSMRVKKKNQYRLFFSDKRALYGTIRNNEIQGYVPVELLDDVTATCSADDSDGEEVLYFGSSDGFVYQLDKGNSFDDEEMPHFIRTHYHHYGSPGHRKQFRGATFEMKAPSYITLYVTPSFSFGDSEIPTAGETDIVVLSAAGFWAIDNWAQFYWGAPVVGTGRVRIFGPGLNMSLFVYGTSRYEEPHNIHGCTVHYSYRRLQR